MVRLITASSLSQEVTIALLPPCMSSIMRQGMSLVPFQVTASISSGPKPQDLRPNSRMGGMLLLFILSQFKYLAQLCPDCMLYKVVWLIFIFMDRVMRTFE